MGAAAPAVSATRRVREKPLMVFWFHAHRPRVFTIPEIMWNWLSGLAHLHGSDQTTPHAAASEHSARLRVKFSASGVLEIPAWTRTPDPEHGFNAGIRRPV